MLKKMTLLALALMTLSSCGPALDETGAVKPENVRFKGVVRGHNLYSVSLPSGSVIYYLEDGESALVNPGKYPDYVVEAGTGKDVKDLSTENLIARRAALKSTLEAVDMEITRRAETLQEQLAILKKEK